MCLAALYQINCLDLKTNNKYTKRTKIKKVVLTVFQFGKEMGRYVTVGAEYF